MNDVVGLQFEMETAEMNSEKCEGLNILWPVVPSCWRLCICNWICSRFCFGSWEVLGEPQTNVLL